jgi:hypothetical protein
MPNSRSGTSPELTGQGGSPNGAYWLYKWYADMSGDMVTTTPPPSAGLFDGAASVTDDRKELDVVAGGASGPSALVIDGLGQLSLGQDVDVKLEFTPSYGRTTAVAAPVTISDTTYKVGADGSITIPTVMNPAYAYHVVVTPSAATPKSLAGTYTIANANSGLALDTAGEGTSPGAPVDQSAAVSGDPTQTWQVVDAGSGLYKVVNAVDGLALAIKDSSTANGAPALVWTSGPADDQLWQLVPDGKGRYRMLDYGTGLALAVDGMSKADGAQVLQWTDGSVTSGCTATGARQPGRLGTALSFCNSNAYVTLPAGTVGGLTGDYTVSVWVNPASNTTWSRLFDIGTDSTASMFVTLNDGNELRYAITTGGGAAGEQRINSTGTLPLNQWSLVTVTLSGTTGTLYVNGKVVGTNTAMTNHPSAFGASTRNYIGKSQYGGDPALNGSVDDFTVYSRALSASEVSDLATGTPGAGDVVHYTFDEAGGPTVPDSSGSGRNGTIVNGTATTTTSATDSATADHFWVLTPALVPTRTLTSAAAPVDGWYSGNVLATLATTVAGATIQYQVDAGAWKTYSRPFTIAAQGRHTVSDRLLSGNLVVDGSAGTFAVDIDKTPPTATVTKSPANGKGTPRNPVALTFTAQDAPSGVMSVAYNVNGGAWTAAPAGTAITFGDEGSYVVGYRAEDAAGNVSAAKSVTVQVTADAPTAVKAVPAETRPGGYETFLLEGFHRYATVDLTLGSVRLGSATTDVNGKAKMTVQIPLDTASGTCTATAAEQGSDLSATVTVKVTG